MIDYDIYYNLVNYLNKKSLINLTCVCKKMHNYKLYNIVKKFYNKNDLIIFLKKIDRPKKFIKLELFVHANDLIIITEEDAKLLNNMILYVYEKN